VINGVNITNIWQLRRPKKARAKIADIIYKPFVNN
jgi:hypothetical protein